MDQVLALATKEASSLACEGAVLLLTEKPLEASSKFNFGLEILRVIVRSALENERSKPESCSKTVTQANEFIQLKIPGLADERFYVFDSALLYTGGHNGGIDHGDAVIRSGCVLFNLALCFHQLGKASNSQDALQRAIDLYRTCAHLLLTTEDSLECGPVILFAMAALNNEACLHFDLGCLDGYYRIQAEIARTARGLGNAWSPDQQRVLREFQVNFSLTELGVPAARVA